MFHSLSRKLLLSGIHKGVFNTHSTDHTPLSDARIAALPSLLESLQSQFCQIGLQPRFCRHWLRSWL